MLAVWDGTAYRESNNILPEAERIVENPPYVHDVCPVNIEPSVEDGLIRMRVFEPEGDLSYLDEIKLQFVDIPDTVGLSTTRAGAVRFYAVSATPSLVLDDAGANFTDSLLAADSMAVGASEDAELILTIPLLVGSQKALDDLGGTGGGSQKQIIYLKTAPSWKWTGREGQSQADYYGVGGGIEVALIGEAFPGGRVVTDTLMPREYWSDQYLSFGSYLASAGDSAHVALRWLGDHKLDHFALTSAAEVPPIEALPLVSATHSTLGDVEALLTTADSAYAVLDVGETIDLVFEAPDASPAGTRRYLFDSKGYYLLFAGKTEGHPPAIASGLPRRFLLRPAAPNPGTGMTQFRYELPSETLVRLRIYDATGRTVATLLDTVRPAGFHGAEWHGQMDDGHQAAPGVYFARMEAPGESQTVKFVFVR